jgi:hypothetical protein
VIGIWSTVSRSPNPWRALAPILLIALVALGCYFWFTRRKRRRVHNPYQRKIVKQNKLRSIRAEAKIARSKFRVIRGGKHDHDDSGPDKDGDRKYFH